MNTDSKQFHTLLTVPEIASVLRTFRCEIQDLSYDFLSGIAGEERGDLEMLMHGKGTKLEAIKYAGGGKSEWAVQVNAYDLGEVRRVVLLALGESAAQSIDGDYTAIGGGSSFLNMSIMHANISLSKDYRDQIMAKLHPIKMYGEDTQNDDSTPADPDNDGKEKDLNGSDGSQAGPVIDSKKIMMGIIAVLTVAVIAMAIYITGDDTYVDPPAGQPYEQPEDYEEEPIANEDAGESASSEAEYEDNSSYLGFDVAYHPGIYDAYGSDFLIPGSDEYYIDYSAYEHYSMDDIQWAINEIYARHGRIFQDEEYSSFFNSCAWYEPTYSADEFDDSWFNEYEKENLKTLSAIRDKKKKAEN